MADLEQFKKERLRMDPSARKLSEAKWQRAYEAHLRAKERVGSSGGARGQRRSKSRRNESSVSGQESAGPASRRLERLREQSAYPELRGTVNLLTWVAIAVWVLSTLLNLLYGEVMLVTFSSVLDAVFWLLAIMLFRLLAPLLIDLADCVLYQVAQSARIEATDEGDPLEVAGAPESCVDSDKEGHSG